jgi:uncharacterized protein YuzE
MTARRSTTRFSTAIFSEASHTLHYYPETDSLYIELQGRPGAETREIAPGLVADIDADGAVVGIDIDGASRKLDLTTLETIALPVKTTRAA